MPQSNYTYTIHDDRIVAIVDEHPSGAVTDKTVTNNIEDVILEITELEHLQPDNYVWLYCDTDGIWDGFDPDTQEFYLLKAESYDEAIRMQQVRQRLRN